MAGYPVGPLASGGDAECAFCGTSMIAEPTSVYCADCHTRHQVCVPCERDYGAPESD